MTPLEMGRAALKLHRKGKSNVEIKVALVLDYAKTAQHYVNVGLADQRQTSSALTPEEMTLLRSLAAAERLALKRGSTSSLKAKYIGPAFTPKSWASRIAKKRLGRHLASEDATKTWPMSGLGLVNHWHGGYIALTRAGWALIHALEAAENAA